jgi:hypothetical protein
VGDSVVGVRVGEELSNSVGENVGEEDGNNVGAPLGDSVGVCFLQHDHYNVLSF